MAVHTVTMLPVSPAVAWLVTTALPARVTTAALPSADPCLSHFPYSHPLSCPGLQVFTTYVAVLVNIYWFFSICVLYLVVLLL